MIKIIILSITFICTFGNYCVASKDVPDFGYLYMKDYESVANQDEFLLKLDKFDLSKKINGYYTGVFGSNYKKIDFFFDVMKEKNKLNTYIINGKRKFDGKTKPIYGTMKIEKVSRKYTFYEKKDENNSIHVVFFKYKFYELGDGAENGNYSGYASIVDYFDDKTKQPHYSWFASDFSMTQKLFVGNWQNTKSENTQKCIFSHSVCCVHELPFSSDFYYYPKPDESEGDFPRIKPQYDNPEWHDYSRENWATEAAQQ